MVWHTASQAEDCGFEPELAHLRFSEFMCEVCNEVFGEGKHCDETSTLLHSNLMMYLKTNLHRTQVGTTTRVILLWEVCALSEVGCPITLTLAFPSLSAIKLDSKCTLISPWAALLFLSYTCGYLLGIPLANCGGGGKFRDKTCT